ncbi:MAG: glycosyltransferase family protein [Blastocatellales bacterium]
MKKRVMFYCQHVVGMGHLIRSAEIVRALAADGFDVTFLNGGEVADGIALPQTASVVNLPPIKSDVEFHEIHAAGGSNLEEIKEARSQSILAEYDRLQPDAVVIEMFPFGRRKFAFELIPLLERIQADGRQTKVVCSLRDILVSKRDQARFDEQVCQMMNRYFDLLLVHADPQFQRLEETFPRARELDCPIRYTGFVVQPVNSASRNEDGFIFGADIIVSIGGGRVGGELLDCAIAASDLLAETLPHRMRLFTGPYLPEDDFARLQAAAANNPNIQLDRFTTDFPALLERADLSISMAGYNTCMNLLTAGVPALVYPFTGNNNEEQSIRASKLEALGVVSVIRDGELTAPKLAAKILQQIRQAATCHALDLNGAMKTAAIIAELLGENARAAAGGER